ncbi:GntR family transcriptional regulator [Citricoccus muralis]|uniref:GntR family transcriptional regulator n=1 Tax=Citricoccus muralis TaxID=169134 RepID=A0ABY8H9S2_9MICC|nr:GntR family transcriptional regulator [Citricoccus muralis]WFP17885.1 GntR family transcriptional regulator [Citricoccus muralis]
MRFVTNAAASGELEVEQFYSVYQLAEQLGISRSPVREGLLRLEEAGLIQFSRNKGFKILPVGPQDVAEIFSMRIAVEVPAAARVAKRADRAWSADADQITARMTALASADDAEAFMEQDRRLHDLIMDASGSHRGRDVVNRLRVSTSRLGVSTAGKERSLDQILREHAPILQAVRERDPQRAAKAMHDHLYRTGLLLVEQTWSALPEDSPLRQTTPSEIWNDFTITR